MEAKKTESRFRRGYSKEQLKGKHHITISPPELNAAFLNECDDQRRVPADLIRIILEDRYEVTIKKSDEVHVERHGIHAAPKRDVV